MPDLISIDISCREVLGIEPSGFVFESSHPDNVKLLNKLEDRVEEAIWKIFGDHIETFIDLNPSND